VPPSKDFHPVLLLVENDAKKLKDWLGAARRAGWPEPLLTASSEAEARAVLREHPVDLLVTDLFLSLESEAEENAESSEGLQLIREFKSSHTGGKAVAITGRCGTGEDIAVLALEEAGADDFISSNWSAVSAPALLEYKLRIFLLLFRDRAARSLV
jgi:CheY-like chemotaxis protein